MCEIALDKATYIATQEGNTLGTTSDLEYLNISLQSQLPGEGTFFVIQTEGWSFDDVDELIKVLLEVKRRAE